MKARPLLWLQALLAVGMVLLSACARESVDPLLTLLPPEVTGITFVNAVKEQDGFNVLEYEYFYNGGGVAIGDLNNDGLPDVYLTANMAPDKLYLNNGDFSFTDITEQAGLRYEPTWNTGVTMVDINDDGWLDIYVGRSGNVARDRRRNALYINRGDLTFSEQAARYGLDDPAYTNHATFFDYDRDGDLDAYLLNHSIRRLSNFLVEYMRQQRDSLAGDKLLRNDDGFFTDVSAQAGIIGNPLGFGLSVVASDINLDGWLDLYVSNDYIEDDYLYINQQDGTFAESIRAYLDHTSYSSMGADVADINHDGQPDIFTLDMLAEDNYRQKVLKGPEDHVFYAKLREDGFHEQYMRNMLHVSQEGDYLEVGQLAGIANTDWSWAALFADMDLDGYKDLLVTNGYLRDYTNLDFLKTTLVAAYQTASAQGKALSSLDMVREMPSTRIANYIYRGGADLAFLDQTQAWGFGHPTHSNGAATGDLDGDGDLDIVVNNINQEVHVYRNEARQRGAKGISVRLSGPPGNGQGIGTRVAVTAGGRTMYQEMVPVRGYLSSIEPVLVFGTGKAATAAVAVTWPDGRHQTLSDVTTDAPLTLSYGGSVPVPVPPETPPALFTPAVTAGLDFRHVENTFADFDREPLLPRMHSREGPAMAVGDLNQDGLDDVFVGGARGQPPALFLQQSGGDFLRVISDALQAHRHYEDVDALFFDAEGDGDLDLYVASGGASEPDQDPAYQDRLYINQGFGILEFSPQSLPEMHTSTSVVAPGDFDMDGDVDLFAGGRLRPGHYPGAPRSYLLENTPDGFRDVTARLSPDLVAPGLVTDARWVQVAGDAQPELIVAGEWMPLRVFARQEAGGFAEITASMGLEETHGWWNALTAADLDGDGDQDLVAGNRGRNTLITVDAATPASIYSADFDQNGTLDALSSAYVLGQEVLIHWRDAVISQVPSFARRFPTHESYARSTVPALFTGQERASLTRLHVSLSSSSVFENLDGHAFRRASLPVIAQVAPLQDILTADFDRDGHLDLLIAGNQFGMHSGQGRLDAGRGMVLTGDGELGFQRRASSGLRAAQDVRRLQIVHTPGQTLLLVASSNGPLETYRLE